MRRTTWPDPGDERAWAELATAGHLPECPPGLVVRALQTLHFAGSRRTVDALAIHVSDLIARRLRRIVGRDHPGGGNDIVERAHAALLEAIFDPESDDAVGLVEAFWPRVRFRAIDAARAETTYRRRHPDVATDGDGEPLIAAGRRTDAGGSALDIAQALVVIANPKKRLAFRLYVEGMQVRAGSPCIAEVVGCDPKTAAKWIAEVRCILAAALDGV